MSDNIVVRFIRNGNNSNLDDVVRVSPEWEYEDEDLSHRRYRVSMKFSKTACMSNRSTTLEQVVTADKLVLYLSSLLQLVVNDTDPFENVQVDLPTAPSVMFRLDSLQSSLYSILGLVEVTLHSWPTTVSRRTTVDY